MYLRTFCHCETFSLPYNDICIILSVTNADTELCRYSKVTDNPEAAVANAKGCH